MSYEANKKWRLTHPGERAAMKRRNYQQTQNAPRSRSEWTSEELELLFDFPGTDRELSKKIGRSIQAIQVKRAKGRASERDA